jgi:hypothetical protein
VSAADATDTGGYRIYDRTGRCLVRATGGKSGFFDVGQLERRRTRRHCYDVSWDAVEPVARQQSPLLYLGPTASRPNADATLVQDASCMITWTIVMLPQDIDAQNVLLAGLSLLQGCRLQCAGMWMVTYRACAPRPLKCVTPNHSGLWSLMRSARSEASLLGAQTLDVDGAANESCAKHAMHRWTKFNPGLSEPEACVRDVRMCVPHLAVAAYMPSIEASQVPESQLSTQLVTGGTGGLGLLTANWLAQKGPGSHIGLLSRSATLSSEAVRLLHACNGAVTVHCCNIADSTDVCASLGTMQWIHPPLRGFWHTAGVLADGLVMRQDASMICYVHGPKVQSEHTRKRQAGVGCLHACVVLWCWQASGAWHLQRARAGAPLDACVQFSSIAGLIGGAGQSNYAASNGTCRTPRTA